MRAVSLFSGCGGSDLGAKRAGVDVIFANDNYGPAAKTYRKYRSLIATEDVDFRDCDVRDIATFPDCELLIGCYPCQSFTMGGRRTPEGDARSILYREFERCLGQTNPLFFVAENVAGMTWLDGGSFLAAQTAAFASAGKGYAVSAKLLDAKDYGVPADRRRVLMVGVRRDLGVFYWFPDPTHGAHSPGSTAYVSHGDAIGHLPLHPDGEYYDYAKEPFSWWFLSRNRKRPWAAPAYTVVSNWRHVTLHPASPTMRLVESDLAHGWKQKWEFTGEYEHIRDDPTRPCLERPRRLSWRECALLQTFPEGFEPEGDIEAKFWQIGNAVPPLLMEHVIRQLVTGEGLRSAPPSYYVGDLEPPD